jgi:hypothetical protein
MASTDSWGPERLHILASYASHLARSFSTLAHPAATLIAFPRSAARSAAFAISSEFRRFL